MNYATTFTPSTFSNSLSNVAICFAEANFMETRLVQSTRFNCSLVSTNPFHASASRCSLTFILKDANN